MTVLSRHRHPGRLWLAAALSLLLHAAIALLLMAEPWAWQDSAREEQAVFVDLVIPERPKPRPAPPAPRTAEPPLLPPVPPPSVPQMQQAPLAEESTAPPGQGDRARNRAPATPEPQPRPRPDASGPQTAVQPPAPPRQQPQTRQRAGNRQDGTGNAGGRVGPTMTQSESDFFLSQIVSAWVIDFDAPQFSNLILEGRYIVMADGMLAPPFGKNDPWDMRAMVGPDWDVIGSDPRYRDARIALESFFRAMRLAQPLAMPQNAGGYPKVMATSFRIGDLAR